MSERENNKQISLSINPVGTYQRGASHKRPVKTQVAKQPRSALCYFFFPPGVDAKSLRISASQLANSQLFVPFVVFFAPELFISVKLGCY